MNLQIPFTKIKYGVLMVWKTGSMIDLTFLYPNPILGHMAEMKMLVHGGVNTKDDILDGCQAACRRGYDLMKKGGSALDAVTDALVMLEDDERYNAGTGSYMKLNGEVEMDASIMTGDGRCGAVACIRNVKNPILVARKVMENTPHVLLVGEGAINFARKCGFKNHNPVTEKAVKRFHEARKKFGSETPKGFEWIVKNYPEYLSGTIGAVARDSDGSYAAALSTGGHAVMIPGRVGDTPIIGAGIYAGPKGAVVATGTGEEIVRRVMCKGIYDMILQGKSADEACAEKVSEFPKELELGLVALCDRDSSVKANRPMAHAIL
jgi:beta-aspartyl-peptidase (threonine type)